MIGNASTHACTDQACTQTPECHVHQRTHDTNSIVESTSNNVDLKSK
jgi:hypothetical protein